MKSFFKKKEYLVQVTVVEARNLISVDPSGTSNPFCRVTVANENPQITTIARGTSSVTWKQSFTFANLFLADIELESMELRLEVYSHNEFAQNDIIGSYAIGLATLYRNMNHEFYNQWLKLKHPDKGSDVMGYILVSCYIIGKYDLPPVHGVNDDMMPDEVDELDDMPEEELTAE
jgi:hypothetical protein